MTTDARASGRPAASGVLRDVSLSALVAGLVAVLVSHSGPFAVITQAAHAGHLTEAQTTSWVWAISIGSGVTCSDRPMRSPRHDGVTATEAGGVRRH